MMEVPFELAMERNEALAAIARWYLNEVRTSDSPNILLHRPLVEYLDRRFGANEDEKIAWLIVPKAQGKRPIDVLTSPTLFNQYGEEILTLA